MVSVTRQLHPMNITPTIRLAKPGDLTALAALFDDYRQFYAQAPDLAHATHFIEQRMLRSESIALLACTAQGEAIGFCQLYPSFCSVEAASILVLSDLFVRPDVRRSGAGKALLQAAEALAAKRGVHRLNLTTARTNHVAQRLYESLGWVQDRVYLAYNRRVTPALPAGCP